MKRLTCEMCGGTDLVKQDGVFVCQYCGTKYSTEEAKKQIITPAIIGNNKDGDLYEANFYPITKPLLKRTCDNFIESLEHIIRDNEGTAPILTSCINAQKEVGQKLVVNNGCYIATAVYGSYDCPQVWTLRRFRDYTLAKTWYGRAFIKTYYAISPTLVKWFGHTKWFKSMWKMV